VEEEEEDGDEKEEEDPSPFCDSFTSFKLRLMKASSRRDYPAAIRRIPGQDSRPYRPHRSARNDCGGMPGARNGKSLRCCGQRNRCGRLE